MMVHGKNTNDLPLLKQFLISLNIKHDGSEYCRNFISGAVISNSIHYRFTAAFMLQSLHCNAHCKLCFWKDFAIERQSWQF